MGRWSKLISSCFMTFMLLVLAASARADSSGLARAKLSSRVDRSPAARRADAASFLRGPGGAIDCSPLGSGQAPDTIGQGAEGIVGVVSDNNPNGGFVAADDFSSPSGGTITQVQFWGFYVNFGNPSACAPSSGDSSDQFTVTYFSDAGNVPGPVFAGPFLIENAGKQQTGRSIDTSIGPLEESVYTLSHAAVTVAPDECLWLQIENNTTGSCVWLWETAPPGNAYSWQSDGVNDFDLSWCVDIPVSPGACLDACDITCSPLSVPEFEPDCGLAGDTVNGGCNSNPPIFSLIQCGEIVCGTSRYDGMTRDTDWFQVSLSEATEVSFSVTAEFPVVVGILDNDGIGDCEGAESFLSSATGPVCTPTGVTACLPSGTWWLFVAPQFINPIACGAEYEAQLTCIPCVIQTGACCVQGGCLVLNSSQCGALGGTYLGDGVICGALTCAENEACSQAFPLSVPGNAIGTTENAAPDPVPLCDEQVDAPAVWYQVDGTGTTMTATTCAPGTIYDTRLSVYCGSCQSLECVAGNDDDASCAFESVQSTVQWCSEAGRTYFILVHGWDGAAGQFEILISDDGIPCPTPIVCSPAPACEVICPDFAQRETEPPCAPPTEAVNAGCDASVPSFELISCGVPVCGTSGGDSGSPDSDWYSIDVFENTEISTTISAEFAFEFRIFRPGPAGDPCGAELTSLGFVTDVACGVATTSVCVEPGAYLLRMAPQPSAEIPCGRRYSIETSCSPCFIPANGACCLGEMCVQTTSGACAGIYMGDGSECSSTLCLPPPERCDSGCADTNADGQVDGNDIASFAACVIDSAGAAPAPGCACADTNSDGNVGVDDITTFVASVLEGVTCSEIRKCIYRVVCRSGDCDDCPLRVSDECQSEFACPNGTCSIGFTRTCGNPDCCVYYELVDCRVASDEPPCPAGDFCIISPPPGGGPEGACCLAGGECILATEACCEGDYQGDGTMCEPVGACCRANGDCLETTEECCTLAGGLFHADANCSEVGACCLANGMCIETTEECCMDVGGTFHADSDCTETGACCVEGGTCIETTEACCTDLMGSFHAGVDCSMTGACCLMDGSCVETTEECCMDVMGSFHAGADCSMTGACCLMDGSCVETTQDCCTEVMGTFHAGADCAATGACCKTDGACIETTMECCLDVGGSFDDGASCIPTGACCLPGAACIETTMQCCMDANGSFDAGANCANPGSCCVPSGACVETTMQCCEDAGGSFHAAGKCTVNVGACCRADDTCTITTLQCCDDIGGVFQGGPTCTPNPCPISCTVKITDEAGIELNGTVDAFVAIRDKYSVQVMPGGFAVASYQWTIDGVAVPPANVAIKTYEHSKVPHTHPHTLVFNVTNLAAAHMQTPDIDLFWTRPGDRRLRVKVTGDNGDSCETEIVVRVTNVADPNREIFSRLDMNTDLDHNPAPGGGTYRMRFWHGTWHRHPDTNGRTIYDREQGNRRYQGEKFLTYHDGLLKAYDAWANLFGYEDRTALDTDVGLDPADAHKYLTATGGGIKSAVYDYVRLGEIPSLEFLGDETPSWHNGGHLDLGGDMEYHYSATGAVSNRFWRWHGRVDEKRVEWLGIAASADHGRATIASTVPADLAVNVPAGGTKITVMFNKPVSTNADTDNLAQTRPSAMKIIKPDGTTVTASAISPNANYTEHTYTVPAMSATGSYTVRIDETATGWHVPGGNTQYEFTFTVGTP